MDWESIKENGWQLKKENEVRILSIDGGGIRGLFPAQYLAEIEEATKRKISDFFDLIVGTSTGGIIALGLGAGMDAEDIVDLYKNNAKLIFEPKKFSFGGFINSKYDNKLFKELLKSVFRDTKIEESEVMLCIPSVELYRGVPKVYKTPHSKRQNSDGEKEMWRVAMATSAAPVFFPPAKVFENECNVDGGIWANNPSVVGITEALDNGQSLDHIKVLSIGTGENISYRSYHIENNSSMLKWKQKIVDLMLAMQSKSTINISKLLLKDKFTQVNFKLTSRVNVDSIDNGNIDSLLSAARREFRNTFRINENVEENFFIL